MQSDKVSRKFGMSPGSLVYVGDESRQSISISVIHYSSGHFSESRHTDLATCRDLVSPDTVSWINVSGVHDPGMVSELGQMFGLHPLALEDILNTEGRPKIDDYDDYLFAVLKMIDYDDKSMQFDHEQVSLVIGPHMVISLQEKTGDVFDPLRERIRKGRGRIRKSGADYLAYAIIDMIVDHYFTILEKIGEQIENLQDEVMDHPRKEIVNAIHQSRSQIIFLRKAAWPMRDIIQALLREESELIGEDARLYLRDAYDHAIHVADTVETYRDILANVLDIYLTSVSNKMNEVMKVLTIIATIFIPLTFLAGVYGMNFEYMPELAWPWAYPVLWVIFIFIFIGLLAWFKRKKWL